MVQRFQHGGGVGVALVGYLEHGKQLAGYSQVDDPALVHSMVLLIFQAGDFDAVVLHQGAVAHQDAALVDPAHIALAVDCLTVVDLGKQTAVLTQHIHKDVPQGGASLGQDGGRVDDGGVDMLGLDRLYARQRDAPCREKVTRRDLDNIDAAQLADVAPAGDDRAHLGSAALHHAGRQSREQRTGQRGCQAKYTRHGRGRRGRVLGGNNREKERRRAAGTQANCCWFLSLVPWAALLVKKLRKIWVGRLTSTLGCGSARPWETAFSAPASLSR